MYDVPKSSTVYKQNFVNDTIGKPTQEENALLGITWFVVETSGKLDWVAIEDSATALA